MFLPSVHLYFSLSDKILTRWKEPWNIIMIVIRIVIIKSYMHSIKNYTYSKLEKYIFSVSSPLAYWSFYCVLSHMLIYKVFLSVCTLIIKVQIVLLLIQTHHNKATSVINVELWLDYLKIPGSDLVTHLLGGDQPITNSPQILIVLPSSHCIVVLA